MPTRRRLAAPPAWRAPAPRPSGPETSLRGSPPPDEPDPGEAPPDEPGPAYPRWALAHGRGGLLPSLDELAARAQAAREAREDAGLVARCADERRTLLWARDVRELRSRCRISLGAFLHRGRWYDLSQTISANAEPEFAKSEMLADFVPKYAGRKHSDWAVLERNVVRDSQYHVMGNFWDDDLGVMLGAVRLALQLVASGTMPAAVGPDLDRLYGDARGRIRSGTLPIVLSSDPGGADDRGALAVTEDGRVAGIWPHTGGWFARTVVEINVAYGPTLVSAALADYLLWWAWRLHSYWRRSGDPTTYYTGVACARLAFAELASIGGLLLHESVHFQIGPHCQAGADPTGKGTAQAQGLECLHHRLEMAWIARAASLYNLPAPPTRLFVFDPAYTSTLLRMASGASADSKHGEAWQNIRFIDEKELFDGSRIDVRNEGSASEFEYVEGDGCGDGSFEAQIHFATVGTKAEVESSVPASCSSSGLDELIRASV